MRVNRVDVLTVRIDGHRVRELVVLPPDVRRSDLETSDPRAISGDAPIAGALRALEVGEIAAYDAGGTSHRVELLNVVSSG